MPIPQHRFPPVFQCSPGGLGWLLGLVDWNPNIYSKAGQSSSEKNTGFMIRSTMVYKIANRWFLWADHLPFRHTTKTNITLPRLRCASINFAHTTATPVTITVCPGWNGSPCPWRLPDPPKQFKIDGGLLRVAALRPSWPEPEFGRCVRFAHATWKIAMPHCFPFTKLFASEPFTPARCSLGKRGLNRTNVKVVYQENASNNI